MARLTDLSRSGARVRIPGAPLGLERAAPPALVARQMARILGATFDARLHPERLGSLLCKRLRLVRIGQRDRDSSDVEAGCQLNPPLTDVEASMLGLAIPTLLSDDREGESCLEARGPTVRGDLAVPTSGASVLPAATSARTEPARAPERTVARQAVAPARRVDATTQVDWRAYVQPGGERRQSPFVARAESVSASGVRLTVPGRAMLNVNGSSDVAGTMAALCDAYGSEVGLRLVEGTSHRWTGPARIEMVEVGTTDPHPVTLWLAYARTLRNAELRALNLGVLGE